MASLAQMSANISAGKRLFRDFKDFKKNKDDFPFCDVSQQEDNKYLFHVNFWHPVMVVIHFILEFNNEYPNKPPMILLCGELIHDNIFYNNIYGETRDGYPYICLDLLKENRICRITFMCLNKLNKKLREFSEWDKLQECCHLSNIIKELKVQ